MRILCPMCGFGRELDETKIPPRAQMATCPKCSHKFRFRVVDDLETGAAFVSPAPGKLDAPAPLNTTGTFPTGQDLSAAQPDPMAAQRAAASEAWKRLQKSAPSQPGANQAAAGPAQDAEGVGGAPALETSRPASPVPFEDLPTYGFFPGIWSTIRQLLTGPAAFFRTMPTHGGMAKPLIFHLLLAEFMIVCQYLWSLAGIGATAQYLGSKEIMDMGLGVAQAAPLLLFLVYPLLLVLRLMIMTGVIHLLLRLIRSADSGAEATFRVLCYSAAPLLLGVFPGVGPLIGGAWSIGLTVLGLKEAHRTRTSAAMFAVLVPVLLLLAAVLGLMQGMMKAG